MVLNKVDQLDNNVDFARAFGTLGVFFLGGTGRGGDVDKVLLMCGWNFHKYVLICKRLRYRYIHMI